MARARQHGHRRRARRLASATARGTHPRRSVRSLRFLDIEAAATHRALEPALADELDSLGYDGLDVAAVRGPDRILTRSISHWTYNRLSRDGSRRFAGIRYLSRLVNRWECWALFVPGAEITIEAAHPILRTNSDLLRVAHQYGLTVH